MPRRDALVLVSDHAAVRTLTLNRPSRLNAFTADSYRSLARLLVEADGDALIRVVLLRGAGRAFSSGVDLHALHERPEAGGELGETFDELLDVLVSLQKPLVGAVHGAAVGFGATILLHCDLVLVADDARLRFPFTSLHTAPEAGSSLLLPSLAGPQRAAELLFTSRWIDAPDAVEAGIALRRCAPERLAAEAMELATTVAAQPPDAVAAAKRLLRAGRSDAVRAAMDRERVEARRLGELLGPIGPASDLPRHG